MDFVFRNILKRKDEFDPFLLPDLRTIDDRLQDKGIAGELLLFPRVVENNHQSTLPQPVITDASVKCFYEPSRPAKYICAKTGKYLSPPFTVFVKGETYSTEYIKKQSGRENSFTAKEFIRFDKIAVATIALSFIPVFWYFIWLTAPFALIISIWKFNSLRNHPLQPTRFRFYLAIILSILMLVGFAAFISYIFLYVPNIGDLEGTP